MSEVRFKMPEYYPDLINAYALAETTIKNRQPIHIESIVKLLPFFKPGHTFSDIWKRRFDPLRGFAGWGFRSGGTWTSVGQRQLFDAFPAGGVHLSGDPEGGRVRAELPEEMSYAARMKTAFEVEIRRSRQGAVVPDDLMFHFGWISLVITEINLYRSSVSNPNDMQFRVAFYSRQKDDDQWNDVLDEVFVICDRNEFENRSGTSSAARLLVAQGAQMIPFFEQTARLFGATEANGYIMTPCAHCPTRPDLG